MKNLNKNMLRYAAKNKFSLGGLFVLFSICMTSVSSLGLLASNFSGTYNNVVLNGNQHNIVTNELYLSSSDGEKNKQELLDLLTSKDAKDANLNVRRFEGLTIQSSPDAQSKVIRYEPNYPSQYDENNQKYIPKLNANTLPTDNLQVFVQSGLPYLEAEYAGKIQKFYHLPKSIDLVNAIDEVTRTYSSVLPSNQSISALTQEQQKILKARQTIVYFLAKGENTDIKYSNLLDAIYKQNNNTLVNTVDPKSVAKVKDKFDQFFKTDAQGYNAPIISGASVSFQEQNGLIPNVIRFEDYTSRICVVPPALLQYQNKKVYDYDKFVSQCNKQLEQSKDTNLKIYNQNTITLPEFENFLKTIPNEYKIKVDSVDYLIVGAGITPDFFYPIVSLENTVVNFSSEMTIYTNDNGFKRTQYSFQSAPLESLLLIKYSGSDINGMIKKINVLAEKYLAFPAGTINTFAATDVNNIFSPTAARVKFIKELVATVNAITVLLSIFLTLITLFVVVIILNKFIAENKKTLYVLVAQGISKQRAVASIVLLPLFPCILGSIFSYLLAYFTQGPLFELFSAYWPLDIYTQNFNIFIMFGLFIGFYAIAALVAYLIGLRSLKAPVSSGMNVSPAKLGPLAIAVKKPLAKFGVVTKFRMSLAFGSFSKLLFLSIAVSLFTFTLSFISSSFTSFDNSLAAISKSNTSTMYMNLATPTRNGGQYYASSFEKIGQTFENPNKPGEILNQPPFAGSDSTYDKYYKDPVSNNVPLFRKWADLLYMSSTDLNNQQQKLRFLAETTNWELIGNGKLAGTNPWDTVVAPLLPSNQRNASSQFYKELLTKLLSDNRIIKTDDQKGISKKAFNKTILEPTNYFSKLSTFYIVNNSYFNDYVKENDNIYPIIKLDNNLDLSKLTKQNIETDILKNYGNVFVTKTNIIENIEFNKDDNTLRVELTNSSNVNVLLPRNLFSIFFSVGKSSNTSFSLYDKILDKEVVCNSPNVGVLAISKPFLNFAYYPLETHDYRDYLYKITYNLAGVQEQDETYTYVDASIINPQTGKKFQSFNSKYPFPNNFNIIGIQQNSKYINLMNENEELVNDKLFKATTEFINNKEDCFPVIPNLYAKKLYNLNIGDKITIFARNNVDRYNPKLISSNKDNLKYDAYQNAYTRTFKIIDFSNSTKEIEFYTTMNAGQKTIGLSYVDENNNLILENNKYQTEIKNTYQTLDKEFSLINEYNRFGGFNGVFTNNDLVNVSNLITLYSPSGLYPGAPEFSKDSKVIRNVINYVLFSNKSNDSEINSLGNALYYNNDEISKFKDYIKTLKSKEQKDEFVGIVIDELTKIYRKTAYFAMIDKPGSIQALVSTFSNLTQLISDVEIVVVVLVSFLALIVVIVTSWIIIKDLTQLIVLLKVQGVTDWENTLNILSVFFPTWILSGIITLPILYGALCLFEEMTFTAMNIIVFSPINWWAYVLILIAVGAFLSIILAVANRYIKKINLIESLKW